jgi:hypothetical protein
MTPRLSLRKETLAELTPSDLAAVNGGSVHGTIDTYLTYVCFLIVNAVVQGVKDGTHQLTLVECP